MAELILTKSDYFYFCYSKNYFREWLGFQAWDIAQKAAHILPPRKRPGDWQFAYQFDKHGQLVSIKIVKKSDPMPAKTGLLHVKHLDMSIGTAPGPNRDRAFKVILKLIHEEFFGDKKPTHWDYLEFFANPRHFDLSCRETHCPKIVRKYGAPKRKVQDVDED